MPYPAVQTADFFTITPSTNAAKLFSAYAIYVGGTNGQAKDVNVVSSRGTTVLFKGVPVGTTLWGKFACVRTTNTTANGVYVGFGPY